MHICCSMQSTKAWDQLDLFLAGFFTPCYPTPSIESKNQPPEIHMSACTAANFKKKNACTYELDFMAMAIIALTYDMLYKQLSCWRFAHGLSSITHFRIMISNPDHELTDLLAIWQWFPPTTPTNCTKRWPHHHVRWHSRWTTDSGKDDERHIKTQLLQKESVILMVYFLNTLPALSAKKKCINAWFCRLLQTGLFAWTIFEVYTKPQRTY